VITCQTTNEEEVEDALMTRICDDIDATGSKLAQALLSPDDEVERRLLERHGFEHLADLYFLARILKPDDQNTFPEIGRLDYETFNEANRDRFEFVIEQTYEQSLDCPFLGGFRNGKDALVSHQLSGRFDPAGWRLYHLGAEDVGVLLMSEHPDQQAIELVYFGITPRFRGRGLGRQILAHGIHAAALTGRTAMFLAVDCENSYANDLYNEVGFTELARRRVMIRRSS